MRERFKNITHPKDEEHLVGPSPWYTGDDVPVTWTPEELALLEYKTYKQNYILGNISKEFFEEKRQRYLKFKRGEL